VNEEDLRRFARHIFRSSGGDARLYGSDMAAHMPWLHLLARHWSFGEVVECGVGRGFSTMSLLLGCVERGSTLTSFDLSPDTKTLALEYMDPFVSKEIVESFWAFKNQDHVEGSKGFSDGSVSLVFIDTTHRLEQTRKELAAWLPKINENGVLSGHDYYLHEHPEWKDKSGVKTAVDEFAKANWQRFVLQVMPHDHGLWILWPKI
jgi:predicted O-methyltransferase YrrM